MDAEQRVPFHVLAWKAVQKPGIQLAGRPTVVRDVQYGGEGDPTDRRLVLHVAQLRQLLEVAEASLTQRVVLHGFGVRVQQLRDKSGHVYEHCTFVGCKLEAEAPPLGGMVRP